MSDTTANGALHHNKRMPRAEFHFYFGLIFLLGLGPHVVVWTYQVIRHARLPRLSPMKRALKDAQALTPMIFCG